jgi:hypothetical protein
MFKFVLLSALIATVVISQQITLPLSNNTCANCNFIGGNWCATGAGVASICYTKTTAVPACTSWLNTTGACPFIVQCARIETDGD